ncbi:ATP-dependent Clp protease ATP-binding subunit ClpC [Balneicella halophila]|uniref:ATP-dependent Clp protease ATP-binding subunit ClpC n=1 Tax=Balneicella halophila TaxID=1537566 RepID=A0A7L4UMS9_BALHA|nr:ATP-dependent Clp protease ATP-binding subunit [Balneicella halophila]PVX49931.1 ATP-dependent Clp protease ATP-binding subunit ClpC [Balneicella halophila]
MKNFSQRIKNIISYSREEAERLGNDAVGVSHLYLGILREGAGEAFDYLKELDVDIPKTKKLIESNIKQNEISRLNEHMIPFDTDAQRVLKFITLEARSLKDETIDTEHLLLAILKDDTSEVAKVLNEYDVNYHSMKKDMSLSTRMQSEETSGDLHEGEGKSKGVHTEGSRTKSTTPALDSFGFDITNAAKEGALDPIVGRQKEIERLVQILSRRKKNNPILIGEPGVGKSAIAEGLALRIIDKKVSRVLYDKRVLSLDLASIVAGTKYRGQFEERMKAIITELQKNKDIILFIDEIHTLVGAGGSTGSLDAANMLKPALARGEIQCIGATTLDEYRQHIEKDGALDRRFQRVMVSPTTVEETLEILENIKEKYEEHHNVTYTKEALEACVKLTERYVSDRNLPDKAIDALDEAGSRVHIANLVVSPKIEKIEESLEEVKKKKIEAVKVQDFELAARFRDKEKALTEQLQAEKKIWEVELKAHKQTVDEEHIAEVVAMMTGVPAKRIAQAEGIRLRSMNDILKSKVIGQDKAIEKIVRSIKRNRAGLKDPDRPIGSFIFLGPTGVGKTQLAKILSEYLFDTKDALIRIDMSEYMEKFAVSRLVGAPPGYVGYEEGGQLTEKVRRKPYSIVLLDEIEKAHPDIYNILLQVLDEGQLTDSLGRKVDFRNTIIIMTSNIGSRQLKDFGRGIGFESSQSESHSSYAKGVIEKALKRTFAPEFLNRVDDVVLFDSLDKESIRKIIDIELEDVYSRVSEIGYTLQITDEVKDFIADKGFDKEFGARPLKRAIQKYIEEELAEVIIETDLETGDTIIADLDKKESTIVIHKKELHV